MPSLFDVPGLFTLTVVLGYFELHMTGGGGGLGGPPSDPKGPITAIFDAHVRNCAK